MDQLPGRELIPHIAGIVTSVAVVLGVGAANSAFHGASPAEAKIPDGAYSVTQRGSSGDIRLLLQIAASKALDANPGVVVAYDAARICRGLATAQFQSKPANVTLGLATYYPEIDELIVKQEVPASELEAVCRSGKIQNNQVFVSDKNIKLSSDRTIQLEGDLVGIPGS